MNRKALLAIFATLAASLPQVLPHFMDATQAAAVLSILSALGAVVTGVMDFSGDRAPRLPRPTGKGKIPPIPPPALLLALLVFAGCGGNVRPDIVDARKVTESAFDCVDSASTADDLEPALFACGIESLRVVSVLCSSGVIPRGEFCDRVGTLVQ